MSKLRQTAAGGGKLLSLVALAIILLGFAAPAHAADDNTVSISVDQNAALQPSGGLYQATTNVKVTTSKPYGFNLTMQADTADLINAKDSSIRIKRTTQSTSGLAQNTWGYYDYTYTDTHAHKECRPGGCSGGGGAIACFPTICSMKMFWTGVPTIGEPAAVIADKGPDKTGVGRSKSKEYKEEVIFAANIEPATLPQGTYSTNIVYTATAKPKPAPTVDPTTCKSGDPQNDCQVDLDPNMIPVKYTGSTTNAQWTSLANPEDSSNQGNWYNYNNKQWANAITVKDPSKYKNQTKVVDQSDILGFWVYIPRYAYEVMRRDGTDKPVPAQNFLISFEKTTTPKRRPAVCPEKGKDYRTQCDLDRSYIKGQPSNQGTWATHPAFTFGSKELNGIWFAKFETTGDNTQPTVLPNEAHMSGMYSASYNIGRMYNTAKTLGVADNNNVGGNADYSVPTQNNHRLAKLSSHMVNNNDWGAVTYLSASKYGAGYNGVQINSQSENRNNGNGDTYGTTGCGPSSNGNTGTYSDGGTLSTQQACSSSNPQRAYNGTLGQLASTTNNPTGIYDMSGGGWEYVAASYSSNLNNSNTNEYFGSNAAHPPYVNTYNITNLNSCTFNTCGGQALYETNNGTGDGSGSNQWNSQYLDMGGFASSYPWFNRGGGYVIGSVAGLFFAVDLAGGGINYNAFRVVLAPLQD